MTGTALYNRLGLTSQVPKNVRVASRERVVPSRIGNIETKFVRSYVEVREDLIPALEVLDVVKDMRKIPDAEPEKVLRFLVKTVKNLSDSERSSLIQVALSYPPRVRALLGAILEKVGKEATALQQSLSPLSTYVSDISDKILPEQERWRLRPI